VGAGAKSGASRAQRTTLPLVSSTKFKFCSLLRDRAVALCR